MRRRRQRRRQRRPRRVSFSADEILEACTQVYPVEVAEPAGLLPSVQLRPYQKQSLAFMIDIEQSTEQVLLGEQRGTNQRIRGGFLCDEMGMGKTMVCISLVLANPPSPKATRKTTLIVVNNTLVQQWYDECKRYAPELKVKALRVVEDAVRGDDEPPTS